jgi:tetratricopeptide (TPR) repeat protein
MIYRGNILILILLLFSGSLVAQSPLTYESYEYYRKGEYKKAAEIIDRSVVETEDSANAESWQLKAVIYYEIFTKLDKKNPGSKARLQSLNAVLKSIDLDGDQNFYEKNIILLDRIATSYYNDAVNATNNLDVNNPKFAENSYLEFKRLQKIAYPDKNFDENDKEFYRAEATSFAKKYQSDPLNYKDLFHLTIESLEKVLAIDSNDLGANYNIAVYYHNEGVYNVEKIDTRVEIEVLVIIQTYGVKMFKAALPYMLKAHELNPREETFRGLIGIYNVLYEEEKVEYYTKELEKFREQNKKD